MKKTHEFSEYVEWVELLAYPEYTFKVSIDGRGEMYLQATYVEADIYTGVPAIQFTRRWFISHEMTKSEFVQTAFKCILTSAEHRVREHFRYCGELVFSPHMNIDNLWALAKARKDDTRTE